MLNNDTQPVWSVSQLTHAIKTQLQSTFPMIEVEGEISNLRHSGAGHQYFTLKDSHAVISAVLFRGQAAGLRIQPTDGMNVVVKGRIEVYPPRGSYQIIIDSLREAGRGALLEALEKRKQQLASEGLFDQDSKLPLLPYPRRVAVITSPTGAAVKDILQVLSRRAAAPRITILPTLVQGMEAAHMIADQLERAVNYKLGDVIILARGGGTLEDLMPFNEEIVVRSIAKSPIPIVCGIGHEIDVSLADLAADVRAATPSAAAELVSDRSEDLLMRVKGFRRESVDVLSRRIADTHHRLEHCSIDRMHSFIRARIELELRQSDDAFRKLCTEANERLAMLRKRLDSASGTISNMSPESILARGYARVTQNGRGIDSACKLNSGDVIEIRFSEDVASARIIETDKRETGR